MPFTPYHFGPSGFIGLVFRKWIDIPVFVLSNVIVDVEVLVICLFNLGLPRHRYVHTLLIGAAVGALWGVAAWPLRNLFARIMRLFHIPYETGLRKMLISGILGIWLHNLIDGAYHFDVRILWPNKTISIWKLIHNHVGKKQIEAICLIFLFASIIPYIFAVRSFLKNNSIGNKPIEK